MGAGSQIRALAGLRTSFRGRGWLARVWPILAAAAGPLTHTNGPARTPEGAKTRDGGAVHEQSWLGLSSNIAAKRPAHASPQHAFNATCEKAPKAHYCIIVY